MKEEIRSCKADNDQIIQAQEKKLEVNVILLQINHVHEDGTNGAYGSRYPSKHKSNRSDTARDSMLLDTLKRRGSEHRYYSSFGSDIHHDHHRYYPYRRNDSRYLPDEFKK